MDVMPASKERSVLGGRRGLEMMDGMRETKRSQ